MSGVKTPQEQKEPDLQKLKDKLQQVEKSEQQKLQENYSLKEIIDKNRSDINNSKKQIALLEDKLD